MGRMSGKRAGGPKGGGNGSRGKKRQASAASGTGDGHKDRRKKAREDARKEKRALKRAKAVVRAREEGTSVAKRMRADSFDSTEGPLESVDEMRAMQDALRRKKGFTPNPRKLKMSVDELVESELIRKKHEEEGLTRESYSRKRDLRRKLLKFKLETAIKKDLERFVCWYPGKEEFLAKRIRDMNKYDPQRLRGAAKPAEEAYPWLYPKYHEEKERKALEEERRVNEEGENYLEKFNKNWGRNPHTRVLLVNHLKLALVHLEDGASDSAASAKLLDTVVEQDQDCLLGSRVAWLRTASFIDQGELGLARKTIEDELKRCAGEEDADRNPFLVMLKWDLVLIEYIALNILEEEDASEVNLVNVCKAALESNYCIPFTLALHESMEDGVDGDAVDLCVQDEMNQAIEAFVKSEALDPLSIPSWNPEQIAVAYFVRSISWWRDAGEDFDKFAVELATNTDELVSDRMTEISAPGAMPNKFSHMFYQIWYRAALRAQMEGEEEEDDDEMSYFDENEEDEENEDNEENEGEGEEDDADEKLESVATTDKAEGAAPLQQASAKRASGRRKKGKKGRRANRHKATAALLHG